MSSKQFCKPDYNFLKLYLFHNDQKKSWNNLTKNALSGTDQGISAVLIWWPTGEPSENQSSLTHHLKCQHWGLNPGCIGEKVVSIIKPTGQFLLKTFAHCQVCSNMHFGGKIWQFLFFILPLCRDQSVLSNHKMNTVI